MAGAYQTIVQCADPIKSLYIKFSAWTGLLLDEGGQDVVEYAVMVGLVVLACVASLQSFAASLSTAFSNVGSKLSSYTS